MSKVGKEAKCSRCGQQKTIAYGWVDPHSHQETNYCKPCYEFDYEPVNCDVCGQDTIRRDLAQHKLDMHSD